MTGGWELILKKGLVCRVRGSIRTWCDGLSSTSSLPNGIGKLRRSQTPAVVARCLKTACEASILLNTRRR